MLHLRIKVLPAYIVRGYFGRRERVDLSTDSNVDYSGLSWYIYLTLYTYVSSNKRKDKIAKADRIIMICCGTILYKLSMHGSNI